MFLDSFAKNKLSTIPVGMLYAKDGAVFVIEEVEAVYSKKLTKIQQKAESKQTRQLTIKNNGTIFEPYEIISIPLDLTQSSDASNQCLLEFLGHAGNINNLILESILDTTTILNIMNSTQYKNELTNGLLAISQNLFLSEALIEKLSHKEKIRFFTENKYRTKDNMKEHKKKFTDLIKTTLINYAEDREDLVSENPSELRAAIIKTYDEFYDKNISLAEIKTEIIEALTEKKNSSEVEIATVQIIKDAVAKYKITGENWQSKKQMANSLIEEMETSAQSKIDKYTKKIETINKFPL